MLGIAFEGSACRAAFHVGAIEWFSERGVRFGAVAGASSGALVAAAVATHRVDTLREAWTALLGETAVFQPARLLRLRWPFMMSHILQEALDTWVGDQKLSEADLPLAIPVTRLTLRGRVRRVYTHEHDVSAARVILASCYIPGPYARPVRLDGGLGVDGAWVERVPVRDVLALGARRALAVVADPHGRLLGDLLRPRVFPVPDAVRVLHPPEALPLRSFEFDRARTLACFDIGRAAAEDFARRNEDWLA
ncbi:MAG: patatin-like phospholipase family protein [Alphaproteobacteria bacterium]|nr:patatin-like phospholipase family protein [Alphaproteobacteria bacterium]